VTYTTVDGAGTFGGKSQKAAIEAYNKAAEKAAADAKAAEEAAAGTATTVEKAAANVTEKSEVAAASKGAEEANTAKAEGGHDPAAAPTTTITKQVLLEGAAVGTAAMAQAVAELPAEKGTKVLDEFGRDGPHQRKDVPPVRAAVCGVSSVQTATDAGGEGTSVDDLGSVLPELQKMLKASDAKIQSAVQREMQVQKQKVLDRAEAAVTRATQDALTNFADPTTPVRARWPWWPWSRARWRKKKSSSGRGGTPRWRMLVTRV
jgi:hypothetical protein